MPTKKKPSLCACCGENPSIMRPLIPAGLTTNTKNFKVRVKCVSVPLCSGCASGLLQNLGAAVMDASLDHYNRATSFARRTVQK